MFNQKTSTTSKAHYWTWYLCWMKSKLLKPNRKPSQKWQLRIFCPSPSLVHNSRTSAKFFTIFFVLLFKKQFFSYKKIAFQIVLLWRKCANFLRLMIYNLLIYTEEEWFSGLCLKMNAWKTQSLIHWYLCQEVQVPSPHLFWPGC